MVTDITGVSATEMLAEMLAGNKDPKQLLQLAKRRLRSKIPQLEKALSGNLRSHHKLIIEQLLADIGLFALQIAELDVHIEALLHKNDNDINRLDGTPGINRRVAEVIIAEASTEMERFTTEHHFASWIGICPGQNESAGKGKSGKTRMHELETWQSVEIVRVPLAKRRVAGPLANDRVLDQGVTEMVDYRGDAKRATQTLIETWIRHLRHLSDSPRS